MVEPEFNINSDKKNMSSISLNLLTNSTKENQNPRRDTSIPSVSAVLANHAILLIVVEKRRGRGCDQLGYPF